MRSSVVLPQPDGPSSTRNSPSARGQIDAIDGGDAIEALAQVADLDDGHG